MGKQQLGALLKSRKVFGVLFIVMLAAGVAALNAPTLFRQPSHELTVTTTDGQKLSVVKGQDRFAAADITDIKQGETNTLVLTKKGGLYISGENKYGQLASGTFGGERTGLERIRIDGEPRFTKIDMSHRHAVAMADNGDVWAWGFNLSGQVGNGKRSDVNRPVKVFSGADDIAAGYRFSAALRDGQLWAWGMQCDPATPDLERLAAEFAHDISVGGSYYDGRAQTDAVYCLEQENLPIASITPRRIEADARFTAVSAGYGHLLMLDDQQTAWGFGCNAWGQLGRGHARNDGGTRKVTKLAFPDNVKIKQVDAGFRHGAALDTTGKVWSWGHDTRGNPLTYKSNRTDRPEKLEATPANIKVIDAGHDVTGLLTEDTFYAFGDNQESQISRQAGDKGQYVIQDFIKVSDQADGFSLGYVRHMYWQGE
jgi:alpha-tubulin suppressor-like RCC1 family protein